MNTVRFFAVCLAGALALAASAGVVADELTVEKSADIQVLIKLSGADRQARRMGLLVVRQMTSAMREARPDLPARAFQIVEEEVGATIDEGIEGPEGLIARLIPIYASYFTHDEIKEILAFHRSPIGSKILSVQEDMFRQGAEAGRAWSESMRPTLERRIRARLELEGMDRPAEPQK